MGREPNGKLLAFEWEEVLGRGDLGGDGNSNSYGHYEQGRESKEVGGRLHDGIWYLTSLPEQIVLSWTTISRTKAEQTGSNNDCSD